MNGFNDLKEQFEAQGIAVLSKKSAEYLGKNANLNKNSSKNSGAGLNLGENSALNSQNAEFESFADKEKRLQAEFAEFLKGEDVLKV